MLNGNLICLILFVGVNQIVIADDQAKLLAEFSRTSSYYEVRDSKFQNRYFVVPPAPCSCSSEKSAYVICSSNLEKDLAAQLSQRKVNETFQCDPRAGCAFGTETIYAECGVKKLIEHKGK